MHTDASLEEIKQIMKEVWAMWKETDRRFKETDQRFKETDKKIRQLSELFTGQWGRLIEALVEPSTVKLFKERGIKINKSARRIEVEDETGRQVMEIDILLENDKEVVVIEVKTRAKVEDVKGLLEKLKDFKKYFPRYKDAQVYGAIAAVNFEEESDKYAYRQGLFVLKFSGEVVKIANDIEFKPKVW
jgi:Holliday junction resolvase-like predicted endonuclease